LAVLTAGAYGAPLARLKVVRQAGLRFQGGASPVVSVAVRP
jgi:hypothetical protein